ncbi:MAG: trigger factor [Eggerthellaceae bacterium]|nr:trigger factor [Eggerthellaceae bacterium]
MNITLENLEDNKVKAIVVVDKGIVKNKVGSIYKDFAKKYNFPGFRKGKAPRPVIDNAFGKEAILAQATEEIVNEVYPQVIEQERIFPVGSPDFNDPGLANEGEDFKFEFTQSVKPIYKLSSYDPIEIEVPSADVTETEVEDQIKDITERYQSYEDAPEGAKLSGEECADLSIKATKEDGADVVGLSSDNAFFTPETGVYSEDFEKKVKGMKAGDTKKFNLKVADDDASILMSDVAGQKISFEVTCNQVKIKTTPELTDEWVKETLGIDTVADLRKEIEESIKAQKEDVIPRIKENACSLELVKRFDGEVDDVMVEQTESQLLQDFFTQLQRQGISFDNFLMMQGIDSDQFKQDVKKQATDNVKQDAALDAWADNAKLEASDEDVTLEFERAGLEDPKATEAEWKRDGRLYLIREGIIRAKAMKDIMDNAKVKEITMEEYLEKIKAEDDADSE